MTTYQIEKGFEVPVWRGFDNYYPFAEMEVGDRFKFPIEKRHNVASRCSRYGRDNGKKFITRKISRDEVACYRIK